MGNNPIILRLLTFLLLQGMDVLCPEVQVETCSPRCSMATQTGCASCQPDLSRPPYPVCPYFPFFPPPAAPSYCVQSVVVGGRDDCDKNCTKTVCLKKPESTPPSPTYVLPNPIMHPTPPPTTTPPPPLHHPCSCCCCCRHRRITRYQQYIDKMLDLLKEKCEPLEEPPLVLVTPSSRKPKRRRRRPRKYRLTPVEDNSAPLCVINHRPHEEEEDEEDQSPAIVIKSRSRKCCCCCRPCIKTVLAGSGEDCSCEE